ncbi:sigma-54-dependent transcriptional regulator [Pseudomarimonas salicorniae]|uniref:Sigma-54 dependent transcriptional regulator n=1 Tax=Pseudomarimonas salicorniae TaxID=2933270 RepID=A0ABT0GDL3_9GAMM|nr:sigma-54 dependent transcriptional regulator [Lysobacter sp. CAU 1642]MCK7592110.1 sigma-54 dependent transcriptional regulator [Lysobacter sp. CAU 1642]
MPTVLLIDDNPAVLTALSVLLELEDIHCVEASTPEAGLARLDQGGVDLVIQDMNFARDTTSGEEGEQLFAAIRERLPDLPVILLTAWTHLDAAVRLVKQGAADYLPKPWDDAKLLASVRNLLELAETRQQLRAHQRGSRQERERLRGADLRGLVFADPATERLVGLAVQVARSDVPVLITGPNGAGKERIAAIIQANSAVRDGPFVTLNCGAIPGELIEAELFGAEAGAYTGASRAREGKFEAADGGTLFLDEIGNLPPAGQMKLLRVLETGRFERLGSNREREVKVRVISATNADLAAMIRAGSFREDLYYRLNVINLALPPLAERPLDILPLAESFLSGGKRLGEAARRALKAHPWPGNVRELKNAITRGCLLSEGDELDPAALGLEAAPAPRADEEPDRDGIEAALAAAGGVVAQAAAALGLSRQALYRRMERLGIDR